MHGCDFSTCFSFIPKYTQNYKPLQATCLLVNARWISDRMHQLPDCFAPQPSFPKAQGQEYVEHMLVAHAADGHSLTGKRCRGHRATFQAQSYCSCSAVPCRVVTALPSLLVQGNTIKQCHKSTSLQGPPAPKIYSSPWIPDQHLGTAQVAPGPGTPDLTNLPTLVRSGICSKLVLYLKKSCQTVLTPQH